MISPIFKTPLIRLSNIEPALGWSGQIYAKCEFQNPTGSFKDRGSVTEINAALATKKPGIVCASTGNMAASLAAMAAQAQLPCVVFAPKSTPSAKLKQAAICGALLKLIKGNYDTCVDEAKSYAENNHYLLCGDYFYRRLGQATIGIELAQSPLSFDAYIVPLGNGTLACSIAQGLAAYGRFPRLIGVQGKGADPIYQAWKKKAKIITMKTPQTCASAMNVGSPLDGQRVLDWIYATSGCISMVSDEQIKSAQKLLAQTEGLYVESAAAATLAALKFTANQYPKTVLILTGSGLKESQ